MTVIWISGNQERGVFMKVIQRGCMLHIYTYIADSFSGRVDKVQTFLTTDNIKEIVNKMKEV